MRRTIMKSIRKLKAIIIMNSLLFLFLISISFHFTFYGVQSVKEIHDSHLNSVNHEYSYSSDGNNKLFVRKIISSIFNSINSNSKPAISSSIAAAFIIIIFFILINELYFKEYDFYSKIHRRSLIDQKVRLNN
jgi:hypothetical protein